MNRATAHPPDLLASYYTLAGGVSPLSRPAVSPYGLHERISAAAAAGYRGMGFHHGDLAAAHHRHAWPEIAGWLDDHGIVHREIELLHGWFGPESASDEHRRHRDFVLSAAAALSARHIKIGTSGPVLSPDLLAEDLARLCDDAIAAGAAIALEFSAIGAIPSLTAALALLADSRRENCGLLLDIWHVMHSGARLDEIAALPPGSVLHVELCDGGPRSAQPYLQDTISNRRPCGAGSFPLADFLAALESQSRVACFGVEILSDEFRALPLAEAAARSFDAASLLWQDAPKGRE